MSDISVELAFNANAVKSLNDSDVRTLLGKSSGTISLSDAYGKTKPITGVQVIIGYMRSAWDVFYGWGGSPVFYNYYQQYLGSPQGADLIVRGINIGAFLQQPNDPNFIMWINSTLPSLTFTINGISHTFQNQNFAWQAPYNVFTCSTSLVLTSGQTVTIA